MISVLSNIDREFVDKQKTAGRLHTKKREKVSEGGWGGKEQNSVPLIISRRIMRRRQLNRKRRLSKLLYFSLLINYYEIDVELG